MQCCLKRRLLAKLIPTMKALFSLRLTVLKNYGMLLNMFIKVLLEAKTLVIWLTKWYNTTISNKLIISLLAIQTTTNNYSMVLISTLQQVDGFMLAINCLPIIIVWERSKQTKQVLVLLHILFLLIVLLQVVVSTIRVPVRKILLFCKLITTIKIRLLPMLTTSRLRL